MPNIRVLVTVSAVVIMAVAAVVMVLRSQPVAGLSVLYAVVCAPYVALLGVLGAATAVARWNVIAAIVAVVIALTGIAVQVAWYYLGRPSEIPRSSVVRVLSSNIRHGEADPTAFVGLAAENADVIMVSELTPEAAQRFSNAGISRTFPYSVLMSAPGAGGIGLWSRYPLTPLPLTEHPDARIPAARVEVPGLRWKPVMASVHIKSPLAYGRNSVEDWRRGIAFVENQLQRFATTAGRGAVIVAGDFNSTPDVRQFRDLLTNGYRDAVHQSGAGFNPTFPADQWYPPLITIDHVLVRGAATSAITTVGIAGSDHRGLLARIQIPIDPDAG